MLSQVRPSVQQIYMTYLDIITFNEIQHVPDQFKTFSTMFSIQQNCLLIPYSSFEFYFPFCLSIIKDPLHPDEIKLKAADLLLCMNGENEKGWAIKRQHQCKDVERELKLNAAICMKFKKSTICYDYRLRLINIKLSNTCAVDILKTEHQIITRILNRLYRNYYCWCYRLKLYSLLSASYNIFAEQLSLSKKFCEANIQDYSGFSYLFGLVSRNAQKVAKQQQISWTQKLIDFYKEVYTVTEEGHRMYSLLKYQNWIKKLFNQN